MKDLSHFCCQNKECSDYGKRGGRQSDRMYALRER